MEAIAQRYWTVTASSRQNIGRANQSHQAATRAGGLIMNPTDAALRPHVVILGAGFGGLSAAAALANSPFDVTLVDQHNYRHCHVVRLVGGALRP
jgi:NADPH-dependent 2,4-dienoyl-CoA reductase/sulfur reductase-like enzyme